MLGGAVTDMAVGVCVLDDGQVFLAYFGTRDIDQQLTVLDIAQMDQEPVLL